MKRLVPSAIVAALLAACGSTLTLDPLPSTSPDGGLAADGAPIEINDGGASEASVDIPQPKGCLAFSDAFEDGGLASAWQAEGAGATVSLTAGRNMTHALHIAQTQVTRDLGIGCGHLDLWFQPVDATNPGVTLVRARFTQGFNLDVKVGDAGGFTLNNNPVPGASNGYLHLTIAVLPGEVEYRMTGSADYTVNGTFELTTLELGAAGAVLDVDDVTYSQ